MQEGLYEKRKRRELSGAIQYLIQAFDHNNNLLFQKTAHTSKEADKIAKDFTQKGAIFIDIKIIKTDEF